MADGRLRIWPTRITVVGAGLLLVATAATAATAAACSSGSGSGSGTPAKMRAPLAAEAGARVQTGSDQGSSPKPSPVPGGQLTPAPGSPPVCAEADLRLDEGPATGGASQERQGFVVVLTDVSDRPCSMIGYPVVVASDADGRQEQPAARSEGGHLFRVGPPETVVLQPQQTASFSVEWTAVQPKNSKDASGCVPYARFTVIPPHQAHGRKVERQATVCDAFQVHPVVAGSTGARSR